MFKFTRAASGARFLTAILIVCTIGAGQSVKPSVRTAGYLNGRAWSVMGAASKADYVIGILDGAQYVCPENDRKLLREITPEGMSAVEVAESLNQFYVDPVNLSVPVVAAMSYVERKQSGGSPADLDEYLAVLRKVANSYRGK